MNKLSTQKPVLHKNYTKSLRKEKWEIAEELSDWLNDHGIEFEFFNCKSTPHVRILNVDHWPASSRFYDRDLKLWGCGQDELRAHLFKKLEMKKLNVI